MKNMFNRYRYFIKKYAHVNGLLTQLRTIKTTLDNNVVL